MISSSPASRRRLSPGHVDTLVEGIRSQIIAGDFERGARLPTEKQLQEQWAVSRPVVREAMEILQCVECSFENSTMLEWCI